MLLLVICPMFYSKGKVKFFIRLNNGDHQCIYDVYYVPRMKNNILSLGKLLDKDYEKSIERLYVLDEISLKQCNSQGTYGKK